MRHTSWRVSILAVFGLILTLSAAYWQYSRAQDKRTLQQQYIEQQLKSVVDINCDNASGTVQPHTRVVAKGTLDSDLKMVLDNRIRHGQAGYEILIPFTFLDCGTAVLVNFGWIPRGREFGVLPNIEVPDGTVDIRGTISVPGHGALEIGEKLIEGNVWQNLNIERYREWASIDVLDYVIRIDGDVEVINGLEADWGDVSFGIDKHLSYAGQWLLFSLLIIFLYTYHGYIKPRKEKRQ